MNTQSNKNKENINTTNTQGAAAPSATATTAHKRRWQLSDFDIGKPLGQVHSELNPCTSLLTPNTTIGQIRQCLLGSRKTVQVYCGFEGVV